MIYLDYNATSPLDKRVLEAMMPYYKGNYSNPSSVYSSARQVKEAINLARARVAELINADVQEVIFTSGGTEADNTAIKGIAFKNQAKGRHIVTSKIEHHAVLEPCKFLEEAGFSVTYLDVDEFGLIDLKQLEKSIREDTILVSIMFANNEVGTIQPIKDINSICREKEVYFHTDAVQGVGKVKIDIQELGVDMLSLSSHKFCGPKGVGALYARKGVKFSPLLHGGGHERARRSGTENVAGIAGLGEAAKLAKGEMELEQKRIKFLRDKLETGIMKKISHVKLNGHPTQRLYNTLSVCVKYIEGESMLIDLDAEGICASSGSACTSGSLKPSHVLLAMGISYEVAHGSLRFSLGKYTQEEDVNKVLEVLPSTVERLRKMSPLWGRG
ncbi:MAG: cysteine desulfurase NifS [Candidatus Omnitrophota bacterium]